MSIDRLLSIVCIGVLACAARAPVEAADLPAHDEDLTAAAWQAIVRDGLASSDLRLRVLLADHLESAALADNVELARGSTDPLVLARLSRDCDFLESARATCDAVAIATRWTVADTQNQVAWLALAAAHQRAGNAAAARDAFVRAGQASVWTDYQLPMTHTLVQALVPRDAPTAVRLEYLAAIVGIVEARSGGAEWIQLLWTQCKDAALRAPCVHMAEALYRDGTSVLSAALSASLARRLGQPREVVEVRADTADAAQWALDSASPTPDDLRQVEGIATKGVRAWARDVIAAAGLSTGDAARRHMATRATPASYR